MKTLKNISPLGALAIPTLGIEVPADGTFDCPNEVADSLLEQVGNFEEAKGGK